MEKKNAKSIENINDKYEGYCADLAHKLSEQVSNFRYQLRLVGDNAYGAKGANESWNGMIGELLRKVGLDKSEFVCILTDADQYRANVAVVIDVQQVHRAIAISTLH